MSLNWRACSPVGPFNPSNRAPRFSLIRESTSPETRSCSGRLFLKMASTKGCRFSTCWRIIQIPPGSLPRKLAMRFVADDPPPALVDRLAQKFLSTDGDIREVLRTLFKSPEFWSAKAYRAKVKTPFEFVVSSLRATGTDLNNPAPAVGILNKMGMPLYQMVPPTGYSMTASTWMNSEALVDRMNYALALSNGQVGGTNFDAGRLLALGTLTSRGFPHPNP